MKLNLNVDETTLLKTYKVGSLTPAQWEEVDHDNDLDDAVGAGIGMDIGGESDALGLGNPVRIQDLELDAESKTSLLLTSKSFDPKLFLSALYPNATYQDLARGIAHLQNALEARSEAVRILVEENFDRFVGVKSATDALYAEMKDGLLAPTTDSGSKPLRDHLKGGAQKANQVFLPVLENASKAQKLGMTLGVFERSKFFFNLPRFIYESIEAGKYEIALRDYKKGKYLLENRPGQLLPILPTQSQNQSATKEPWVREAEEQQRRVLDKVWASVEKAVGEMRNVLVKLLMEKGRSVEEQEKTLEVLLELQSNDEPIWMYFDSHHKNILEGMDQAYRSSLSATQASIRRTRTTSAEDDEGHSLLLRTELCAAIKALEGKQPEATLSKSSGEPVWESIHRLVKNVSEGMLSSLPSFWKLGKGFMDGRIKKGSNPSSGTGTRRSPTQCRTMAQDIVKRYIALLSEFFALSDVSIMASSSSSSSSKNLSLPTNAHSLSTAHYLLKIVMDIQETISEVQSLDISPEVGKGTNDFMESVRWRFVDVGVGSWVRDAAMLYHNETFSPSISTPHTTLYLAQIETYQRHLTTIAYKIAGGGGDDSSAPSSTLRSSARQQNSSSYPVAVPMMLVTKVIKGFVDSLFAVLDGMMLLASVQSPVVTGGPAMAKGLGMGGGVDVDLRDSDVRILLVISNFTHLSKAMIPNMLNELESAFGTTLGEDRKTLTAVVSELDKTLFESYVRSKSEKTRGILRNGILDEKMDWYETPRPTEIRPYLYETLMSLVQVHAQVCSVAEPLLDRTLNVMVEELAGEALRCIRQIKRFGMGGMLRATLEIEFMHQALSRYVTPAAAKLLSDLYNRISKAYVRGSDSSDPASGSGGGGDNLQANLDDVKKILLETRKATTIDFLCFKINKSGGGGSKAKARDEAGSYKREPREGSSTSARVAKT